MQNPDDDYWAYDFACGDDNGDDRNSHRTHLGFCGCLTAVLFAVTVTLAIILLAGALL